MSRAVIFANGELYPPLPAPDDFLPDDWFIAADGGARHCSALGFRPNVLIGDFDSLQQDEINQLAMMGVEIVRHPTNKDETDLELALLHAVKLNVEEVIVYAALGARWDMTLANLMLLIHPALQQIHLQLIDGNQQISLLCGGQILILQGEPGDTVSLIPLSANVSGITTSDLEYPLDDGTLILGSPRGVSNVMINDQCQITLKNGFLAIVHIRQMVS
jgi:thiamine pyrophosphokinase